MDPGADRQGRSARLRPVWDGRDVGAVVLGVVGIVFMVVARLPAAGVDALVGAFGVGPLVVAMRGLLDLHASTPTLAWLGAAVYLTHRGRSVGRHRRWVWGGVVWPLPLMLLGAQELAVRGDVSGAVVVIAWNLGAAILMGIGVCRSLGERL